MSKLPICEHRHGNAVDLAKAGHAKEAVRELKLMAEETPDLDFKLAILADAARVYEDLREFDLALAIYKESQEIASTESQKLYTAFLIACNRALSGEDTLALSQYDSILQEYSELLNSAGERDLLEDICFRRAMALASSGNYQKAISHFVEAASFATLSTEHKQTVHLWLGICYDNTKLLDKAREEYLYVIGFNNKTRVESEARYNVARLYAVDGGWAQARIQLETILHDYPPASIAIPLVNIYERLSITCRQLGDFEKANYYAKIAKRQ